MSGRHLSSYFHVWCQTSKLVFLVLPENYISQCELMKSGDLFSVSYGHSFTCETNAHTSLFQWSWWSFLFEKHKSSILCFSAQHSLCIMRCLFRWLMIQEGPSVLLLLCCTFSPPRPTPAASLLRGLCMNSHCHVQGRVAQGQLIAFMIMISRQIYRACSEHIFQVLPTLLAQMGKMSLQLLAVTSCLSVGHTFWLIRVERRGVNHTGFSCKSLFFLCQYACLFFSSSATKEHFFTLSSTCAEVWRSWVRNDTDKDFWFFCRLNFLRAINLPSSFLFTDEIITLIPLIGCQNYQSTAFWCWWLFFFLLTVPPSALKTMSTDESNPFYKFYLFCGFCLMCRAGPDLHCQPRQWRFYLGFWWAHWRSFNSL